MEGIWEGSWDGWVEDVLAAALDSLAKLGT